MKRTLACLLALTLSTAAAAAQDTAKLEADAKKAFDSGRFKDAAEKYAAAAEAPNQTANHGGDLHLQSAWAYFIAGNSNSAREQLKSALVARPDLQVVPDFYSPDFANLAATVKSEVVGSRVPPIDIEELKRSARAKLADGKAEDAVYDLKRVATSTDPEVFRILADAQDRLGHGAEADAARRRASDLEKGLVSSTPIGASFDATGATPMASAPSAVGPLLESAERSLASGDFRAAASYARQASDADPKNAEAHRMPSRRRTAPVRVARSSAGDRARIRPRASTIPEIPVMAARTRSRSFSTARRTAPAKCCSCAPARPYQESFEIVASRFAPAAVCSRESEG